MPCHYNYYTMACTVTEAAANIFSRIIFLPEIFKMNFQAVFYYNYSDFS